MHLRSLALAAVGALALTACSDDGPTFVDVEPQAYVRWVNASPDSRNLVGRFVDEPENMRTWDGVGFRGNTGLYIAVNAGSRTLRVFRSSTRLDSAQMVVLEAPVELKERTYYTIVSSGRVAANVGQAGNTATATVFEDTLPDPASLPAGQVRIRVYHVADGVGPVNVAIRDSANAAATAATATSVSFLQRSAYLPVASLTGTNAYRFTITNATSGAAVLTTVPDLPGLAAAAGTASTPPVDATAGVRQQRSLMSLFIFGPATTGTPNTAGAILLPDQNPPRS